MAPSPRISDKELSNINAAAVTREYRVQPHLGMYAALIEYMMAYNMSNT